MINEKGRNMVKKRGKRLKENRAKESRKENGKKNGMVWAVHTGQEKPQEVLSSDHPEIPLGMV